MRRDKKLSYASIENRLASIASFLSLNDVTVNKKKLNRFMGEHDKTIKNEGYTHEDLQKMFQHASFRTKLLISIYSSTGIRKCAIIALKIKHLEKVEHNGIKLYKFTVYEKSIKDEYITYCTPECATLIDEYIEKRKAAGEKITQESYLIRNEFDFVYSRDKIVKKTSRSALNEIMTKLVIECGLREVNNNNNPSTEIELSDGNIDNDNTYQRHKKPLFHAFRIYFNTCLVNCDVNVTKKEMFMGHSVRLDDSYYKPNEKELLSEYCKAINELTINEENRLRKQVTELEQKQSEIDKMKYEHQKEMKKMRAELEQNQQDRYDMIMDEINKLGERYGEPEATDYHKVMLHRINKRETKR